MHSVAYHGVQKKLQNITMTALLGYIIEEVAIYTSTDNSSSPAVSCSHQNKQYPCRYAQHNLDRQVRKQLLSLGELLDFLLLSLLHIYSSGRFFLLNRYD